ncbi:hypothetical protein JR065_20690 [Xanthomonas sp. AmX2]|uniref:hypothetical protein n=1 Tax=Xanthomonas sp. TaxID=29446 RepID=UPI001980EC30|nr:hypothetical protein [Xanthomonas sp.]MBN6152751.1 hypothetical protein [Xanthomonas sp.]
MHAIALTFLILLAGSSGSASATDRWHQLADEGRRLTSTFQGIAWEQRMLPIHNGFWPDVYRACAPQARQAGIDSFRAVAVIDGTGTIKEYLINPSTPHLACFSKQMVGRKYPAPPSSPFYEVYTIEVVSP